MHFIDVYFPDHIRPKERFVSRDGAEQMLKTAVFLHFGLFFFQVFTPQFWPNLESYKETSNTCFHKQREDFVGKFSTISLDCGLVMSAENLLVSAVLA